MNLTYGISNWIYGEEPLENQFQRLKKFGYDAIEIRINDLNDFDLLSTKKYMEKYSISCSSICPNMTFSKNIKIRRNIIDKNSEVRERSIEYLKESLRVGEELGAKLVLIVPTGVFNLNDKWTLQNQESCSAAIRELGDYAQSIGSILIALEPLNRYENMFLRTCSRAKSLVKKVNHPRVKMMLDFFHCNIEEDNNAEPILLADNDLIHCHVADSNRKSPGRGQTNWFEIYRALKYINYEGAIIGEFLASNTENFFINNGTNLLEADFYTKECIEYLKLIESMIRNQD